MHDRELEAATSESVHAGLVASVASICWTVVASAIVIVLSLRSKSTVLLAFGAVGVFDAFGSVALAVHFRHALHHESVSSRYEKVAQLVVACGLLIVGAATSLASCARLLAHVHTRDPVFGTVVSAVSVAVLFGLATRKRRIARRIPSQALLADSWLSMTGCLTAVMAVAGTMLDAAFGWWWVDPSAALAIAIGALGIGLSNLRHLHSWSPLVSHPRKPIR